MTSEICVMNRLAVVLAADSATTVTQTTAEGTQQRYFKGANKIFQLSHHHPVGLMIYDSADILNVPWEIVVKEFRSHLGTKSFNQLSGYADEFFAFLQGNNRLFPEAVQKDRFLQAARGAALKLLIPQDTKPDEAGRRAIADAALAEGQAMVGGKPFADGLDAAFMTEIVLAWRDELVARNSEWIGYLNIIGPTDLNALADYGIEALLKSPGEFLGSTGLVFAGFGDNDIFPAMAPYKSLGIISGKHIAEIGRGMAIDHDTPAWLSAFAQTSMSDTFSLGVSYDVYSSLIGAVNQGLRDFAIELKAACGVDEAVPNNIDEIMKKASEAIGNAVLERAGTEHAQPLRRVLGVLPVDEMAELAETLINLQSGVDPVSPDRRRLGLGTEAQELAW